MDLFNFSLISIIFVLPQIIFGQQNFEQWHTISIIPKFDIEIYPTLYNHYHHPASAATAAVGPYPLPLDSYGYPILPSQMHPQQQFWQYQTGPTYHQDSSGSRALTYANVQVTQHHHQHFTVIHAFAIASVQISIPDT